MILVYVLVPVAAFVLTFMFCWTHDWFYAENSSVDRQACDCSNNIPDDRCRVCYPDIQGQSFDQRPTAEAYEAYIKNHSRNI